MYLNNLGTPMEIAGDPTRLVEDLVDEAEDLLLQIVCYHVWVSTPVIGIIPDDNDRQ